MTDVATLPDAVRAALHDESVPDWRPPVLATLTDKRFSDRKWIFERKFDGMRCLAFRDGNRIQLLSRNRQSLNGTYPELVDALAAQAPVRADNDYDTVRKFARDVAEVVVADDAAHRTVEARKDKRGSRVYLDIMRNAYAQTAIAPYSVRARAGAPVATPLYWDELGSRRLRADKFTIRDLPKRLAGQPDPWAEMSRRARSLSGPLRRLARLRA